MSEKFSFRSAMNGFNRNDVIAYIDNLLREKAELEEKVAQLEEEVSGLNSTNDTLREIIVDDSKKSEETNKCEECDMAKIYEARFGAAMLDAKRFSETLVKEANDKAAALFSDACAKADDTLNKAKDISRNIESINSQFNKSFTDLLENMKKIEDSVASFKSQVGAGGKEFDYTSDFVSLNGTVKNEKHFSAGKISADVNFDDADDYEIRVNI